MREGGAGTLVALLAITIVKMTMTSNTDGY